MFVGQIVHVPASAHAIYMHQLAVVPDSWRKQCQEEDRDADCSHE